MAVGRHRLLNKQVGVELGISEITVKLLCVPNIDSAWTQRTDGWIDHHDIGAAANALDWRDVSDEIEIEFLVKRDVDRA